MIVTDIQLHKYNFEGNSLLRNELRDWAESVTIPGRDISFYFIELSIDNARKQETMRFF